MQALEKMSIEKNILVHENTGFLKVLVKKKHRRRSKNMKLFFKNESNQAMFFFLNKINVAQSQQQFLNAQKKPKKFEKKLKTEIKIKKRNKKLKKFKYVENKKLKKQPKKQPKNNLKKKFKKFQK